MVATFLLLLMGTLVYLKTSLGLFEPRITRANFERLVVGMNEVQVRQLLGSPTWIDNSAVPRGGGLGSWQGEIHAEDYPRKFFWEDGENLIWAELFRGRVRKVGATLDGEQFGEDPRSPERDNPSREAPAPGD